jgi:hypothetical protein
MEDERLDLAEERGVAQQKTMRPENGGLAVAELLGDAADNGVEFLGGGRTGPVETIDLSRHSRFVNGESSTQ